MSDDIRREAQKVIDEVREIHLKHPGCLVGVTLSGPDVLDELQRILRETDDRLELSYITVGNVTSIGLAGVNGYEVLVDRLPDE